MLSLMLNAKMTASVVQPPTVIHTARSTCGLVPATTTDLPVTNSFNKQEHCTDNHQQDSDPLQYRYADHETDDGEDYSENQHVFFPYHCVAATQQTTLLFDPTSVGTVVGGVVDVEPLLFVYTRGILPVTEPWKFVPYNLLANH
jgi:hypothetical protein